MAIRAGILEEAGVLELDREPAICDGTWFREDVLRYYSEIDSNNLTEVLSRFAPMRSITGEKLGSI